MFGKPEEKRIWEI